MDNDGQRVKHPNAMISPAKRPVSRRAFLRSSSCAVLIGSAGYPNTAKAASDWVSSARLTVVRSTRAGVVVPAMAGLSFEKSKLSTPFFAPENTSLVGCFRRLGSSILRIGGNAVDHTSWSQSAPGGTTGQVAPADIDNLAAFLRETGWQALYGINLASNSPASAAAEAKYVTKALGSALYGFEIGNECDLYSWNGLRPKTYTVNDFIAEWSSYAAAIRHGVPEANLTGPSTALHLDTWTLPFASSAAAQITLLTHHYYQGAGGRPTSTMPALLAEHKKVPSLASTLHNAADSDRIHGGYRIVEANSYSSGGATGVSDAHGSAIWAIDFLLVNARFSSAGVNFHGGSTRSYNPPYTPLVDDGSSVTAVRPVYYGMLFFTQLSPGPMAHVDLATTLNLSAYAIVCADGKLQLVIVNKEPLITAIASIDLGARASRANLLAVTGPGPTALIGTTIAGSTIGHDGAWAPLRQETIEINGPTLSVQVSPVSALLLRLE